jgi:GNAT superfamily N-acetyltransferase
VSDSPLEFRIEPLGDHDRATFSCGVEALDRYLKEQASQDARKRVAAPFVLVTPQNRIAGYYTLSATGIHIEDLPHELVKRLRLPHYRILGATLLGRLASDVSFRGQGLGELLLMDALKRAWENSAEVGSIAVIVDAKDDRVGEFYKHYNFIQFLRTRGGCSSQ